MLTAFARAFRTPDLRKKLLFTLGIIVLFRVGSTHPVPGRLHARHPRLPVRRRAPGTQSLLSLVNLFSGGALLQLSVFALGIMPYITSSIIIQLLSVVIPRLERLKQGGPGRGQQDHAVHALPDLALAVLQSTGIVALARSGRLFPGCSTTAIIPNTVGLRHHVMVITHDRRHRGDHVAR